MMWRKLSRNDAAAISEEWNSCSTEAFLSIMESWDSELSGSLSNEYRKLRDFINRTYDESIDDVSDTQRRQYIGDLLFGLKMYDHFCRNGMNASIASDDDVWSYIQIRVVPDLVYRRWSEKEGDERINNDRFWKNPRRIWMKTLWWYIHLSLQNNSIEATKKILMDNTSDDITQLVERTGGGYRVDLYRSMMKRYSESEKRGRTLLRNVLKLNVVFCATAEPLLFELGVDEYVEKLFSYFGA